MEAMLAHCELSGRVAQWQREELVTVTQFLDAEYMRVAEERREREERNAKAKADRDSRRGGGSRGRRR